MRKKGEKGAPTSAQMKRAKGESNESFDLLENNLPKIINDFKWKKSIRSF